jgi:carboxypeptidase PM20D1
MYIYLLILAAVVIFPVAVLFIKTALFAKPNHKVAPLQPIAVDNEALAQKLAEGIRCRTISYDDPDKFDHHAFYQLRVVVESSFPFVQRFLERHEMGTDSLVYIWRGSRPDLNAIILMGHLDVVPVDAATEKDWQQPPFDGAIMDGFVWGRGSLDCKGQVFAILEAVESLLKNGFQPQRTIYLAFGHDEEVVNINGAKKIAEWLETEGVRAEAVLDEGGYLSAGLMPGVRTPVALVASAEKGYLTLELVAEEAGGHSSIPPRQTAIDILAQALIRLKAHPLPAHVESLRQTMRGIGAAAPAKWQLAFANLWLFKGMAERQMAATPYTNAAIRTTDAATMFSSGVKENILPQRARALVNLRLMPGDSAAMVTEHVRKVIDDQRIRVRAKPNSSDEASPVSEIDTLAYRVLGRVIRQLFNNVPVAPFLELGATDARHYHRVSNHVYRFSPYALGEGDLERSHGVNERISVQALGTMAQFYAELVQQWGKESMEAKGG